MRLLALLMAFSVAGCATLSFLGCNDVPRPDSNVCVVNVALLEKECHNLKNDYDDNGNLKPGVPVQVTKYADEAAMLAALNKTIDTDADSWAAIKAYIRNLRAANQ